MARHAPVIVGRNLPTTNRAFKIVLSVIMLIVVQMAPAFAAERDIAAYTKLAREGYRLAKSDVEQLEASLVKSPDDLAARTKLLGFYYRGALPVYGRDATIETRRGHILWLIEHHPESEATSLSEVTIDAQGHALADKLGYERASTLWIEQGRRHARDVAVLKHAAKFFQLSNKDTALSLLKQAQDVEPQDRDLSALIGYVYALGILGVDMINQNGLPTSHNRVEANGAFAARAKDDLGRSSDPIVVGVAGQITSRYGMMLAAMYGGTDKFAVDYPRLAETFLAKARELDPTNSHWPSELEQLRKPR